jgi:hypothetical protein
MDYFKLIVNIGIAWSADPGSGCPKNAVFPSSVRRHGVKISTPTAIVLNLLLLKLKMMTYLLRSWRICLGDNVSGLFLSRSK